jgi:hypothetical protein
MSYDAWMKMQEVSEGKVSKADKIAAILGELHVCTVGGKIAVAGPLGDLQGLAESIYREIWERSGGQVQ